VSTVPIGRDATALRAAIVAGEHTVLEVVEAYLARTQQIDDELHAYLVVDGEGARRRARELDAALAAGESPGPLFGVPVALKANMCLEGMEINCGSRVLQGYRPPYTATFVARLLAAGAVPLGMTGMDEFAMGSSGENTPFDTPRNPWDLSRTAGGSSTGSAVAVAADMVPIALGSDTGGSVRQPAAFCGIYGMKPTYGRVSRYGLVAFGSSLDQVSPFARSVRDLELVLSVISGHDEADSTSLPLPPFESQPSREPGRLLGVRIGLPKEYFSDDLDSEVRDACNAALATLEEAGAELVPVELPHTKYAIPTYYVVATAEASSNLARYDGVAYGQRRDGSGGLQEMFAATRQAGFGDEVKRRILLGTYVLSAGYYDAWYGKALKVRTLLRRDFEQAFESVDLIAGPTTPTPPFRVGEKSSDALAMYLSDILTVPASLAGLPALSLPAGFATAEDGARLPVGLQLIGPRLAEASILRAATALESNTALHEHRAPAYAVEASR